MEAYDGFSELQAELLDLAKKIGNPDIIKSTLEEGGKIIIERASNIVKTTAKQSTGNLENNIVMFGFDKDTQDIIIGWDEKAFYGKILEKGFVPWTGKTKKAEDKDGKIKHSRKARTRNKNARAKLLDGKTKVYLTHLDTAFEETKHNITDAMLNKLSKEIE